MKAFLLAGGLGTRLRPLTSQMPKCLVPIGSTPLLQIWLELLGYHGITEVLINTHYLSEMVQEFAETWSGPPKLRLSHEVELLGSAGTLGCNWDFVEADESFLVCYADNLTDVDLTRLIHFHQHHHALITLTLFRTERPRECGIAEVDQKGRILSFEEKPAIPKSNLANGGIYAMRGGIRSRLPRKIPSDIGFHLLPQCIDEMYGWFWEGLLVDIGNPESYRSAQTAWNKRKDMPGHRYQLVQNLSFAKT